jgi:arylsulfatase A-like enzyme
MRFTDAYAACPVCSPTRGSILAGKYPARLGITQWIGGSNKPTEYEHYMALEEVTIAEALKEAGYARRAADVFLSL